MRDAHALVLCVMAIASLAASTADAQLIDSIHGRLELEDIGSFNHPDSLDAFLGTADHNDGLANLRLIYDQSWDRWSLDFTYLVTLEDGQDVRETEAQTVLIPEPPSTWFNFTDTFVNNRTMLGEQTIDRLSLTYSAPDFVIRVGRQALTWGSGFVFRPMDLFDPFSPIATDTEYKPGTDMLYAQYLFADGSDLQFIAVPRAPDLNGAPTANDSSFALHYHGTLLGLETTALLARDHGDWTGALGLNGPLSGATWNIEILPTNVPGESTKLSALANISDAETWFDRNATVFAEYFHNGFGVEGTTTLATLPSPLKDRLARGQLFNVREDYLAAGATIEWTPLLTLNPTAIVDANDGSFFLLMAADWSLANNLVLIAGVEAPFGPRGSEFGGLPLAPGSPTFLSPPTQIYLQLRRYF